MKFVQASFFMLIGAVSGAWITTLIHEEAAPHPTSMAAVADSDAAMVADKPSSLPKESCVALSRAPEREKERQASETKSSDEGTPPQTPNVSLDQLRHQEDQVRRFRENIAAIEGASPLQTVKRQYQAQPVDYQWAVQKEEQLLSLFESHASLGQYAPLDVSCKSQTCQVVMAAETEQQGQLIYDAFLKANNQTFSGEKGPSISYFNDPKNGQLVMYTSEKGVQALFDQ